MNVKRGQVIPGLILIVLGIVFLLMQYFEFGPGLFLTLLGLVFLLPYVFTRSYGLLIPGCILVGLGVGLAFERVAARPDVSVSIGLGLAFCAIYLVQWIATGASHWWPLVPGGILILVGLAEIVPQGQAVLEKGWPLILVLIGMLLLAGSFLRATASGSNASQDR
ncbi:MAG: hypothetical protein KGJ80_05935 [Chloroflexota bacterium]|nr:hypothetical protein [Chloroflexota bacterium]